MPDRNQRAVIVSSVFKTGEVLQKMGIAAYSYHFVFRAFAPLLERWGVVREVTNPESRLDYALYRARRAGLRPFHLSVLPLHCTYLTRHAANVAFPFWEFPDIPDQDHEYNSRHNWVRVANRLDLILTASTDTHDALRRAGVRTPIHVVPVPISEQYFAVPPWRSGQEVTLDCPCYLFPHPPLPGPPLFDPYVTYEPDRFSWKGRLRAAYKFRVRGRLPDWFDTALTKVGRLCVTGKWDNPNPTPPPSNPLPFPLNPTLPLQGVVYTSICNPFDPRKNWEDLLSAYLLALRDREDATLVLKLAVNESLAAKAFRRIFRYYKQLPQPHRCKLAVVAALLSDEQMTELARASTYYVNSARAEGACLPLQNFLAAGRPGLAPVHSALAEYFEKDVGFVVNSQPEPAVMPHTPGRQRSTTWHRLDWQALCDQFRASYTLAKENRARYEVLAGRGRDRMAEFAGAERVWPRLRDALEQVPDPGQPAPMTYRQAS